MKIGKKIISFAVVIIIILTVVVLSGSFFYLSFLERQYESEVKETLHLETEQIVSHVNKNMSAEFDSLDYLSKFVLSQDVFDCEKGIEKLKLVKISDKYLVMGVADADGNAYLIDGTKKDISDEEYFKRSMQGEKYITETMVDEDGNIVNLYSVCIKQNEECVGVLFVCLRSKIINDSMQMLNGREYDPTFIVDEEGTILFCTEEFEQGGKLSDFLGLKKDSSASKRLYQAIGENVGRYLRVDYQDVEKFIYTEELGMNDWYVVTMISTEENSGEKDEILSQSNLLIGAFFVLYFLIILLIMVLQDRNKRKVERLAYVDELTGGNSFLKFKKDADKLVKNSSDTYALVDIDVDKFKYINDIFGYEEGNNVIRFIWKAIDNIIEPGETFAHYRADQFVLLLKANDMDHVLKRIESLSVAASNRESRNEKNYEIILSVGIYIIDKVNYRMDTSIDRASLTKKSIKGKHSQIYAIYDEKIRQKVLRDQEIENMMERALRNEEFKVYYQPKFDSTTCELTGAEALVRWYNDEIGMIFPNEFISVFENNGFISELDKYMFEHVCMDIRSWLDEGYNVVPVSVNLSQLQLYNLRFVEEYKEILKKYDIPPEYIQLELTETTLFSKVNSLNKIIDELHKIGFKILMDDFGTGYSSLNMLKNVPVDILKLDKSFVDDIGEPKGDIVVSTIVSLGQLLNMRIIAEGVETKEQYEFLRDIFCDEIQGYYFSKPIPEGEYRKEMMKGAL